MQRHMCTAAKLYISTAANEASDTTGDRHDWHDSFGWQEHIDGKSTLVTHACFAMSSSAIIVDHRVELQ